MSRAVLVLEYEVDDPTAPDALQAAWWDAFGAMPQVEGARHVNTHAAIRETAEAVLAVIQEAAS